MWLDDSNRRDYQKELYEERRKWAIDFLGGKCVHCGTEDDLTIDHKDPTLKSYNISEVLRSKPKEELIKELKKCQTLCKECHKEKTINDGAQNIGERNGSAKLNRDDIIKIRDDKRPLRKIALDYEISHVAVLKIKQRVNWSHIGG